MMKLDTMAEDHANLKENVSEILRDLRHLWEKCHIKTQRLLENVETSDENNVSDALTGVQNFIKSVNENVKHYSTRFNRQLRERDRLKEKREKERIDEENRRIERERLEEIKRKQKEEQEKIEESRRKERERNEESRRKEKESNENDKSKAREIDEANKIVTPSIQKKSRLSLKRKHTLNSEDFTDEDEAGPSMTVTKKIKPDENNVIFDSSSSSDEFDSDREEILHANPALINGRNTDGDASRGAIDDTFNTTSNKTSTSSLSSPTLDPTASGEEDLSLLEDSRNNVEDIAPTTVTNCDNNILKPSKTSISLRELCSELGTVPDGETTSNTTEKDKAEEQLVTSFKKESQSAEDCINGNDTSPEDTQTAIEPDNDCYKESPLSQDTLNSYREIFSTLPAVSDENTSVTTVSNKRKEKQRLSPIKKSQSARDCQDSADTSPPNHTKTNIDHTVSQSDENYDGEITFSSDVPNSPGDLLPTPLTVSNEKIMSDTKAKDKRKRKLASSPGKRKSSGDCADSDGESQDSIEMGHFDLSHIKDKTAQSALSDIANKENTSYTIEKNDISNEETDENLGTNEPPKNPSEKESENPEKNDEERNEDSDGGSTEEYSVPQLEDLMNTVNNVVTNNNMPENADSEQRNEASKIIDHDYATPPRISDLIDEIKEEDIDSDMDVDLAVKSEPYWDSPQNTGSEQRNKASNIIDHDYSTPERMSEVIDEIKEEDIDPEVDVDVIVKSEHSWADPLDVSEEMLIDEEARKEAQKQAEEALNELSDTSDSESEITLGSDSDRSLPSSIFSDYDADDSADDLPSDREDNVATPNKAELESSCQNLVLKCTKLDQMDQAEIDRLCNLNNIDRKKVFRKITRVRKTVTKSTSRERRSSLNSSGSSSETLSSSSSSGSVTPDIPENEIPPQEDRDSEDEADALAQQALENMSTSNSDSDETQICSDIEADEVQSAEEDDEDRNKETEKEGAKTDEQGQEKDENNTENPEKNGEDKTVSKRREYDALLHGKLWSASSDSDDDVEKSSKSTRSITEQEENDLLMETDEETDVEKKDDEDDEEKVNDCPVIDLDKEMNWFDSDSDSDFEQKKTTKAKKTTKPNQNAIVISDSDDSSGTVLSPEDEDNSDIEFLNEYQETDTAASGGRGRRNIREILDDEELAEETIIAKNEETQRIQRLEQHSKAVESLQSQHEGLVLDVDLDSGQPLITVDAGLTERLKPHQKDGVQFMWEACYENVKILKKNKGGGCILAHCMGLGKTLQVITLIHTLFSHDVTNTKHVLIICPLSTVLNWKNEFRLAARYAHAMPKFAIKFLVKEDMAAKCAIIRQWQHTPKGVLVMGYEAFQKLTNERGGDKDNQKKGISVKLYEEIMKVLVDPGPDLVICDEGHMLKNGEALRTQALMKIRTRRRIVLTGTPLQNNLKEYYFMVAFVKPHILGTFAEYRNRFVNPIMNGQYDDSNFDDIQLMKRRTHVLNKLLKKTIHRYEAAVLKEYLPDILDHTLFIRLHPVQVRLYERYIDMVKGSDRFKTGRGFFADFAMTKYICLHPYVLECRKAESRKKKRKEKEVIDNDVDEQPDPRIPEDWYKDLCPPDVATNIDYGTKLRAIWCIIEEAERLGDKVLIFAHKLAELDCIEHFLKTRGTKTKPRWLRDTHYHRMDGHMKPNERNDYCDGFNSSLTSRVFLISHRVGGLGLNLTAANRVILIAPDFNPSHDSQSIFRIYRFGQSKKCFVYRLTTLGSMEEKMYQKCVVKSAVAGTVVDKRHIARHYKVGDTQAMYMYGFDLTGERPIPKVPADQLLAALLQQNENVYKYHEHQALLENRPEEELTDAEKKSAWDEYNSKPAAPAEPAIANPNQLIAPLLPPQNQNWFPNPNLPSTSTDVYANQQQQAWLPNQANPFAANQYLSVLNLIRDLRPDGAENTNPNNNLNNPAAMLPPRGAATRRGRGRPSNLSVVQRMPHYGISSLAPNGNENNNAGINNNGDPLAMWSSVNVAPARKILPKNPRKTVVKNNNMVNCSAFPASTSSLNVGNAAASVNGVDQLTDILSDSLRRVLSRHDQDPLAIQPPQYSLNNSVNVSKDTAKNKGLSTGIPSTSGSNGNSGNTALSRIDNGGNAVLSRIGNIGSAALSRIDNRGNATLSRIGNSGNTTLSRVGNSGNAALSRIGNSGNPALSRIGNSGIAALSRIDNGGNAGLSRVGNSGNAALSRIRNNINTALSRFGNSGNAALSRIGNSGNAAVSRIGNNGNAALSRIGNSGSTTLSRIGNHGNTTLSRIGNSGNATISRTTSGNNKSSNVNSLTISPVARISKSANVSRGTSNASSDSNSRDPLDLSTSRPSTSKQLLNHEP